MLRMRNPEYKVHHRFLPSVPNQSKTKSARRTIYLGFILIGLLEHPASVGKRIPYRCIELPQHSPQILLECIINADMLIRAKVQWKLGKLFDICAIRLFVVLRKVQGLRAVIFWRGGRVVGEMARREDRGYSGTGPGEEDFDGIAREQTSSSGNHPVSFGVVGNWRGFKCCDTWDEGKFGTGDRHRARDRKF
jgi:hypothetical protein